MRFKKNRLKHLISYISNVSLQKLDRVNDCKVSEVFLLWEDSLYQYMQIVSIFVLTTVVKILYFSLKSDF